VSPTTPDLSGSPRRANGSTTAPMASSPRKASGAAIPGRPGPKSLARPNRAFHAGEESGDRNPSFHNVESLRGYRALMRCRLKFGINSEFEILRWSAIAGGLCGRCCQKRRIRRFCRRARTRRTATASPLIHKIRSFPFSSASQRAPAGCPGRGVTTPPGYLACSPYSCYGSGGRRRGNPRRCQEQGIRSNTGNPPMLPARRRK
jgi:hypothetical protein